MPVVVRLHLLRPLPRTLLPLGDDAEDDAELPLARGDVGLFTATLAFCDRKGLRPRRGDAPPCRPSGRPKPPAPLLFAPPPPPLDEDARGEEDRDRGDEFLEDVPPAAPPPPPPALGLRGGIVIGGGSSE